MFQTIAKSYFPKLISLIQETFERRNSLYKTGFLFQDERIDANVIVSILHQLVLEKRSELSSAGIDLIDSDSSNAKFFLSIPQFNCRIRFGKMDRHFHMAKHSRDADLHFADQQYGFPGFGMELRLHLGYVLAKDDFSLEDIAIAQPRTIDDNIAISKLSDEYEKNLFVETAGISVPASGTLLSNLKKAEEKRVQITVL